MRRILLLWVAGGFAAVCLCGCGDKPGTPSDAASGARRAPGVRGASEYDPETDMMVKRALLHHPDYREKVLAQMPQGDPTPTTPEAPPTTGTGTPEVGDGGNTSATPTTPAGPEDTPGTVTIQMTAEQKRAMIQMVLADPTAQKKIVEDFNTKMEDQKERDEFLKEMASDEDRKLFKELMLDKVPGFKAIFDAKAEKYPELKKVLE